MMNQLLSPTSVRRVSRLAMGALLILVSTGYGTGAIAAPQSSLANKDILSDLLGNDSPILDAITETVGAQAEDADATTGTETSADTGTTTSTEPTRTADASSTTRFTCQYDNGEFVVMYSPESEPGESYAWAIPGAMGGGWTPERRCNAIAERLEDYRPDGLLELQTGIENNYNTVCATTTDAPGCRIVFTVPNGQDPVVTRDRVFENLAIANSGQETTGVNTFTGSSSSSILTDLGNDLGLNLPTSLPSQQSRQSSYRDQGIDLRPFLDPADGGTL